MNTHMIHKSASVNRTPELGGGVQISGNEIPALQDSRAETALGTNYCLRACICIRV